jgi:lysophospholipase L1-like esterase/pimeloyl-ACP methyl ester carboxylesterase
MKKQILIIACCCLFLFSVFESVNAFDQERVRIACVGDSITYGATIPDRMFNCYPNQLAEMLGKTFYQVKNFGQNGATVLKKGTYPYWNCEKFQQSKDFNPHIVFLMLGTNDNKKKSWQHKSEFESDYRELVNTYKNLPSSPKVILLTPIPALIKEGSWEKNIQEEMIPMIQKVAYETGSEIIDLHRPFFGHENHLPDGLHPNSFGAELIARKLYAHLAIFPDENFDIRSNIKLPEESSNFFGYRMTKFQHNKRDCILVEPRRTAMGRPWLWRARFWANDPQVDIALLEKGFHLVYCDVAGLFGAPQAVEIWNQFYDHMQKAGLNSKVALEGLSRAGLIMFNWTHDNPEKVACIYADAPVCDIKSWPGGRGSGVGNPTEWPLCMKVYGFKTEEEALKYQHNPIDNLEPIAKAGIPLLHVCGDSDKAVPVNDNTAIIEKRYLKLGGSIKVILKPGVGHHPHCLKNPKPITDFILKHTNQQINFATVPAPSAEHRGKAAGWGEGTWWNQFENINSLAKDHADEIRLLFFGDSITQFWTGSEKRMSEKGGDRIFDKEFADLGAVSFGISGDRTEHLLYRIEHGNLDPISPEVIVLMAGVNNLYKGYTGEETAEGIEEVVQALREKKPESKIILLGSFPTGPEKDSPQRKEVEILQKNISHLGDEKHVFYRNINQSFLNEDGTINYKTIRKDNVHLIKGGYQVWADEIKPLILKLMKN